jgi:hypothetical protein
VTAGVLKSIERIEYEDDSSRGKDSRQSINPVKPSPFRRLLVSEK